MASREAEPGPLLRSPVAGLAAFHEQRPDLLLEQVRGLVGRRHGGCHAAAQAGCQGGDEPRDGA
jgi:hypothetical protein